MTAELHQTRMATAAEPPFHDEVEAVWGRRVGRRATRSGACAACSSARPGRRWSGSAPTPGTRICGALVDPDGGWYWTRREPPDVARAAAQHAGLVAALEADGVEVVDRGAAGQCASPRRCTCAIR